MRPRRKPGITSRIHGLAPREMRLRSVQSTEMARPSFSVEIVTVTMPANRLYGADPLTLRLSRWSAGGP
jgi:hypothetical protein